MITLGLKNRKGTKEMNKTHKNNSNHPSFLDDLNISI